MQEKLAHKGLGQWVNAARDDWEQDARGGVFLGCWVVLLVGAWSLVFWAKSAVFDKDQVVFLGDVSHANFFVVAHLVSANAL